MYLFEAFNLKIHSELYFPELLECASENTQSPDIFISFGEVPNEGLENPDAAYLFVQTTKNTLWLRVPGIAYFLIKDGNQIIIDPAPNVDEDSIRVFLLGSCLGALLMQRNLYLLHGNAIRIGSECISFVGPSGAGKSTLSGAFFKQGYELLADDLCAINSQGEVIPSFPQIKLWSDAAQHLNINTHTLRKIRPNLEKFAVSLGEQFYKKTLPLKTIFILNHHNKDEISFETLTGMSKIEPLKANTYRYKYVTGLNKTQHYLEASCKIANQINLIRINRPKHGFKLNELITLITQNLHERGIINA